MITKVDDINMVPDDIRELLLNDKGEYIAIGSNVYELKQFPVKKYFELLGLMSKYFSQYNILYKQEDNKSINEFFGTLAKSILDNGLIDDLMKAILPDVGEDGENITFDQLKYLLGVVYKLNFLSRNHQIKNMETRLAHDKMMQMLGIHLMNES